MKGRRYLMLLLMALYVTGCDNDNGEQIAQRTCGSCHLFPKPSLLPAGIWEQHVLPQMAKRLGITTELGGKQLSELERRQVPAQPLISEAEWKSIKRYYLSHAPASLTDSPAVPVGANIGSLFRIQQVQLPAAKPANISCVRINPPKHELYAADAVNHCIWYIDQLGIATNVYKNENETITDIQLENEEALETSIGPSLNLTPEKLGSVSRRGLYTGQKGQLLLNHLYRPVQTLSCDVDGDQQPEMITCEFGVDEGKLSVWKNNGNGYTEKVLYNVPGAIHMAVTDMNGDGRPDILALFGQGNEQLLWFENKGHLTWEPHVLLRFPPVYGSTSFDIADMDGDGRPDIIYTCGDNADYSPVLKPYHGIYIYHNDGGQSFSLRTFLPQNGAYKVLARDFDGDGDIDLASIAYFPNTNAEFQDEFRLYLNNNGKFSMLTNHLGNLGRWLVMDAADIDGDGDCDIVLGSFPMMVMAPGGYRKEWQQGSGVVLLLNQSKH